MRLKLSQKVAALAAAPSLYGPMKQRLIRRYWQRKPEWKLDFHGVSATFGTDDFYSNYWFYGPQNIQDVYEPAMTRLTIDLAKKSTFFADIGANLGYFAVLAAKANPNLKVVAIELDETLAPIIDKNLRLNQLSKVKVKSGAVGDGSTLVPHQPHTYSFLSLAADEAIAMPRVEIKTRSFRLDDYFGSTGSFPDLVKMDVDGAEVIALQHAEKMLAYPKLTMFLEIQTRATSECPATANDVGRLLSGRGFSFYTIAHELPVRLEPIDDLSTARGAGSTAMILVTRRPLSFFGLRDS